MRPPGTWRVSSRNRSCPALPLRRETAPGKSPAGRIPPFPARRARLRAGRACSDSVPSGAFPICHQRSAGDRSPRPDSRRPVAAAGRVVAGRNCGRRRGLGRAGRVQALLDQLATGTSSRDYSDLASKLDVGALGGVVLEHVLESEKAEDLALRLFTGLLSEGLMVLATRQHVKAWEGELVRGLPQRRLVPLRRDVALGGGAQARLAPARTPPAAGPAASRRFSPTETDCFAKSVLSGRCSSCCC